MDRRIGELADQPDQPAQPEPVVRKRTITWIRPRHTAVEIRTAASNYVPPGRLQWITLLRLGTDLFGIVIFLGVVWFLLAPLLMQLHLPIDGAPDTGECRPLLSCQGTETGSTVVSVHPGPLPQTSPTLTHRSLPRPTPPPGLLPSPMPTPSPTSVVALLQVVPDTLTLSHKKNCDNGQSVSVQLTNVGGITLVWMENKGKTSDGLSISSAKQVFVLLPGQTTRATITCAPKTKEGQDQVQVAFNGGVAVIVVVVN